MFFATQVRSLERHGIWKLEQRVRPIQEAPSHADREPVADLGGPAVPAQQRPVPPRLLRARPAIELPWPEWLAERAWRIRGFAAGLPARSEPFPVRRVLSVDGIGQAFPLETTLAHPMLRRESSRPFQEYLVADSIGELKLNSLNLNRKDGGVPFQDADYIHADGMNFPAEDAHAGPLQIGFALPRSRSISRGSLID